MAGFRFGCLNRRSLRVVVVSHRSYARMGLLDQLEVRSQNHHESKVSHIWRALCARCGTPSISPLRCAPVEMTKLGAVADQAIVGSIHLFN